MELWINALLPIKVFNAAILIAAMLMFSHGLPKKDHFQRRLFLWALFSLFAAAAIPIITDSLWYVTSVFLVMYLLSMLTVRICYRVSWPMVFFIAAAAFSADHIASMLDSTVALFAPEILQYTDTGLLNLPVLFNYGLCRVLVFGLVDLLIVRKNRDVDDDSIRFAPSLLILIISLIVNLYMNIVFSNLVTDRSFWLSLFNFAMPEDYAHPLGYLLGLEGYAPAAEPPAESFSAEMLLMDGLRGALLDRFLDELRRMRAAVPLKAVVTEHNAAWSSLRLHRELEQEHLAMSRIKGGSPTRKSTHKKKR